MVRMAVNDNQRKKVTFVPEVIDDLHRFIIQNHNEKSVAGLFNLMKRTCCDKYKTE
jgi:hypothetical protein